MQYYMRVQSGFVAESESELGAATGLIRGLDVRRAPGEEEPRAVSIAVSQDLVHWTLYHLPVPEQPSESAASAEDTLRARAEAAETEARDACTAADEAEHRASLAIDSAQELARCVLQATQPQGSWVDHPPMGDWAGVVDSVSALRARAEAAEARAAQAEADARLMLHELVALDESEGTNVIGYWRGLGLTDAECDALRGAFDRSPPGREEAELAVVRRILASAQS